MFKSKLSAEDKTQIQTFVDSLYFDVQFIAGSADGLAAKISEDYLLSVITKFAVSLASVFWSVTEILQYIKNRKDIKNIVKDDNVVRNIRF